MRIAHFLDPDGREFTGELLDDRTALPLMGDLFGAYIRAAKPVTVARLLPPVTPPNIFAIGRNYKAHAAETGSQLPEKPLIFGKPTTALNAPEMPIVIPAAAPLEVDYEAELAVVIGRRCRHVTPDAALDYVFGYTCANDVSARDCQKNDKQWTRAKGFDTFCPLGPWLVTGDAFDPTNVAVRSRLNGQTMQDARTSAMVFDCRYLVSYLSQAFTLLPGTLILTGTPEGVGMARTPPVFLRPGDTIEIEIEGIGVLRSPVVAAAT